MLFSFLLYFFRLCSFSTNVDVFLNIVHNTEFNGLCWLSDREIETDKWKLFGWWGSCCCWCGDGGGGCCCGCYTRWIKFYRTNTSFPSYYYTHPSNKLYFDALQRECKDDIIFSLTLSLSFYLYLDFKCSFTHMKMHTQLTTILRKRTNSVPICAHWYCMWFAPKFKRRALIQYSVYFWGRKREWVKLHNEARVNQHRKSNFLCCHSKFFGMPNKMQCIIFGGVVVFWAPKSTDSFSHTHTSHIAEKLFPSKFIFRFLLQQVISMKYQTCQSDWSHMR